jgi:hypothetical protein
MTDPSRTPCRPASPFIRCGGALRPPVCHPRFRDERTRDRGARALGISSLARKKAWPARTTDHAARVGVRLRVAKGQTRFDLSLTCRKPISCDTCHPHRGLFPDFTRRSHVGFYQWLPGWFFCGRSGGAQQERGSAAGNSGRAATTPKLTARPKANGVSTPSTEVIPPRPDRVRSAVAAPRTTG